MEGTLTFFVYKSKRKNAKNEMIKKYIYDNVEKDRAAEKIVEIMQEIISALEKIGTSQFVLHPIACFTAPNTYYIDANKNNYTDPTPVTIRGEKRRWYSIEQVINLIYQYYMIINPLCKLHKKELFENPSIKYTIKKYYGGNKNEKNT